MISNALKTATEWSGAAAKSGYWLFMDSLRDDGTLGENLTARALFIAQIVISIVSMPLLVLGSLFGSGLALCTEGKEAAYKLLKGVFIQPLKHLGIISSALFRALNLQETVDKLRGDSIKDNGTWGQALTARALFIAQAVIALVGTPLMFLSTLFASGAFLCKGKIKQAYPTLKVAVIMPIDLLASIPTNLIAAVVPHSLEWDAPRLQVSNCLKNCCFAPRGLRL